MKLSKYRKVLECGSPLPLGKSWVIESGRGLPQSKTLTRHTSNLQLLGDRMRKVV